MEIGIVLDLAREAIVIAMLLAGPPLIAALLIGVVISLFQAVTSIQEQTLTFVPKLAGLALIAFLLMPWMLRTIVEYTRRVLMELPMLIQ